MFSAISDRAAASSRRSISKADGAGERVDDLDRPQPARARIEPLDRARGEIECREIALETPHDTRTQHLDGDDRVRRRALRGSRLVDLCDRGGRDRLRQLDEVRPSGPPRARSISAIATARGKGGIRSCNVSRSRATPMPTTSGRVARNWPSLTQDGPSRVSAAARPRPPVTPRRSIRRAAADGQAGRPGNSVTSTRPKAPSRARVQPARARRKKSRSEAKDQRRFRRGQVDSTAFLASPIARPGAVEQPGVENCAPNDTSVATGSIKGASLDFAT